MPPPSSAHLVISLESQLNGLLKKWSKKPQETGSASFFGGPNSVLPLFDEHHRHAPSRGTAGCEGADARVDARVVEDVAVKCDDEPLARLDDDHHGGDADHQESVSASLLAVLGRKPALVRASPSLSVSLSLSLS